jgi:hypothetical protein
MAESKYGEGVSQKDVPFYSKGEVQTNMSDPDEEVINFGVADKLLEENKKGARNG